MPQTARMLFEKQICGGSNPSEEFIRTVCDMVLKPEAHSGSQGWGSLVPAELLQLIKAASAGRFHFSLGHLHPVKDNLSFGKSSSSASTLHNLPQ